MTRTLRIGEVAGEAGVNIQTLRYYERRGLVVAPFRRHSGQREYPEAAVARVRVIKTAQRLGFTLAEIEELFDLAAHRRGTGEIRARAAAKIREIDDRIDRLSAMKAELRELLETECDSLTGCSCGLGYMAPFERIGTQSPPIGDT